ncbi:MAG: methylenetetrahydrofolate reductase [NAD(P)H] [Hyphomicrobiales bacterium]|nr:methylenetetrahydrofolate reductase [NAD(P)H] [Hyphomicrobiales bacterium]
MVLKDASTGRSFNTGSVRVSFEFFPPKTAHMEAQLWSCIERLAPIGPDFVSVTYGAGGSTRERTHNTVARLVKETPLKPAAHLTCVAASKAEVDAVARGYWEAGVRHIVALRGDPPTGAGSAFAPHPGGYETSADLVAGLRRIGDFEVSVTAYPEKHPEAASLAADIDVLARKVDAGATRAITQFFFDPAHYFRYLDKVRARGITIPIIPGLIPIHNFRQVASFAGKCGATIPAHVAQRFEGVEDDEETTKLMAATVAAELVTALAAQGVELFHFYTLNRANLVYAICHLLGLRPAQATAAAASTARPVAA